MGALYLVGTDKSVMGLKVATSGRTRPKISEKADSKRVGGI